MRERGAEAHAFESSMTTGEPARQEEQTRPERAAPVRPLKIVEVERGMELPARAFEIGATSGREQELWKGRWVDEPGPNQDTPVVDEEMRVVGVADGMGGHAEGEKASQAAQAALLRELRDRLGNTLQLTEAQAQQHQAQRELETLRRFVEHDLGMSAARLADEQDMEQALRDALRAANQEVAKAAPKGGTTLSLLVVHERPDGTFHGKIVHRGDSRLYMFRGGGLEQLTHDHSLVERLKDKGLIDDPEAVEQSLSDEALKFLAKLGAKYKEGTRIKDIRNVVTAALSAQDDVTHTPVRSVELRSGDLVIAVSDGPSDNLTHTDLTRLMRENAARQPGEIAKEIVRESRAVAHSASARAKEDDMTAVVAKIGQGRALKEVLQQNLITLEQRIQSFDDDKLGDETVRLVGLRNQAEIALEAHPDNEKLQALQAHIIQCLERVAARQVEVRQHEARRDAEVMKPARVRAKKEPPVRSADAAH